MKKLKKWWYVGVGCWIFILLNQGIFLALYNWNKTRAESFIDPINWIFAGVSIATYFAGKEFLKLFR